MKIALFQADAFTDHLFGGNPAAVVPLETWLPEATMQQIAMENNLAETAFFIPSGDHFHIRWFTPAVEVDLCGHATLAAAHILFNHLGWKHSLIAFESRSGLLKVSRDSDLLTLDFPADEINRLENQPGLNSILGAEPVELWQGKTDLMAVFDTQQQIEQIHPDMMKLAGYSGRGMIVTAPGKEVDFVSRFFAPQVGIPEDPVTGSAHTTLAPYWSKRLGKEVVTAIQLSARKGLLQCQITGNRVRISGKAVTYLTGEIDIK